MHDTASAAIILPAGAGVFTCLAACSNLGYTGDVENTSPTPPRDHELVVKGTGNQPTPAPGANGDAGTSGDVSPHKAIAVIGYIIPLLFFIPLLTDGKHNPYAKFHANQQLNLLLFWIAINIIAVIPILGWLAYVVGVIFGFVLMVMGIISAANGRQKVLPLIGKITLLK